MRAHPGPNTATSTPALVAARMRAAFSPVCLAACAWRTRLSGTNSGNTPSAAGRNIEMRAPLAKDRMISSGTVASPVSSNTASAAWLRPAPTSASTMVC